MFYEKSIGSPSKGKVKEESSWNSGWWNFYPLVEHPRRPVEWSNSSVIFTPHAVQPLVVARHFSSSRQFTMPSPKPLVTNPASYDPPTILSASPDCEWLFAYFPSSDEDGVCCLWNRGTELDKWAVKEYWRLASNAGVVAATWLSAPREWIVNLESGLPARLPFRGPSTPISHPTLLFVTQDHRITLCYLRHYVPMLKMFSCSLSKYSGASEVHPPDDLQEQLDDVGSLQICLNAAFSLGYNDSTILVATRSQTFPLPPSPPDSSHYDPMNLDIPPGLEQECSETYTNNQEDFREQSTIELCEVYLKFDGVHMNLSTQPLPPLQTTSATLRDLHFICQPPLQSHPTSGLPGICLIASFYEFEDYTSIPKSSIVCYTPTSNDSPGTGKYKWLRHSRSFESEVLAFTTTTQTGHGPFNLLAGIYNTSGIQTRRGIRKKEGHFGVIKVLKVPELSDDDDWEPSFLFSPADKIGKEIPVNIVTSPNHTLLCTLLPSPWTMQTAVQRLPRKKKTPHLPDEEPVPPLSLAMVTSIFSRRSTDDLTHVLSQPSTPSKEIVEVLYHCFVMLDRCFPQSWTYQLGLTLESYRTRSLQVSDDSEKGNATLNWQTLHDMCSVVACNSFFDDCKDGEGYNTDAIWQMVDLCSWIIALLEQVAKECIISSDFGDISQGNSDAPSSPGQKSRIMYSTTLLHLVHPFALQNLRTALNNVKHFRMYLGSLTPRSENAQIARDVLVDLIDCSGIDIRGLEPLLSNLNDAVKDISDDEVRRSLASCALGPSMQTHLKGLANTLSHASFLDKSRLFIKPFELADGTRLSVERPQKNKSKDVVSKGILLKRAQAMECLRCGGQSELGKDSTISKTMIFWEKSWARRCVCGGSWISAPP